MRTPGADAELAAGFLFTEGLVPANVPLCFVHPPAGPDADQRITVELPPGLSVDLRRAERHGYTSSSCGVCGKVSLDLVRQAVPWPELPRNWSVDPALLGALPARLRAAQRLFARTGGIHAAGLFTPSGELLHHAEDVGRHNALDKLIGHYFLRDALPLDHHLLLLSGRASFELIQKAAMAGIRLVAAVGAPSSLAASLAREEGIELYGFLRPDSHNRYG